MKKCIDCGKSLKGRGNNVKRCRECQEKHRATYKVKKNKDTKIKKEIQKEYGKENNKDSLTNILALSDDELEELWQQHKGQWGDMELPIETREQSHDYMYIIASIVRKRVKKRKMRNSYLERLYRETDKEVLGKRKEMDACPNLGDLGDTVCMSENELDDIRKRKYGRTDEDEEEEYEDFDSDEK